MYTTSGRSISGESNTPEGGLPRFRDMRSPREVEVPSKMTGMELTSRHISTSGMNSTVNPIQLQVF